jgi:phosphoketolase
MHAYWRAANYLFVGQIYLMDNPLLKEPLVVGGLFSQDAEVVRPHLFSRGVSW